MINRYTATTKYLCLFLSAVLMVLLIGCKEKAIASGEYDNVTYEVTESVDALNLRDNTPIVLEPVADGSVTTGNDNLIIDYGNAS